MASSPSQDLLCESAISRHTLTTHSPLSARRSTSIQSVQTSVPRDIPGARQEQQQKAQATQDLPIISRSLRKVGNGEVLFPISGPPQRTSSLRRSRSMLQTRFSTLRNIDARSPRSCSERPVANGRAQPVTACQSLPHSGLVSLSNSPARSHGHIVSPLSDSDHTAQGSSSRVSSNSMPSSPTTYRGLPAVPLHRSRTSPTPCTTSTASSESSDCGSMRPRLHTLAGTSVRTTTQSQLARPRGKPIPVPLTSQAVHDIPAYQSLATTAPRVAETNDRHFSRIDPPQQQQQQQLQQQLQQQQQQQLQQQQQQLQQQQQQQQLRRPRFNTVASCMPGQGLSTRSPILPPRPVTPVQTKTVKTSMRNSDVSPLVQADKSSDLLGVTRPDEASEEDKPRHRSVSIAANLLRTLSSYQRTSLKDRRKLTAAAVRPHKKENRELPGVVAHVIYPSSTAVEDNDPEPLYVALPQSVAGVNSTCSAGPSGRTAAQPAKEDDYMDPLDSLLREKAMPNAKTTREREESDYLCPVSLAQEILRQNGRAPAPAHEDNYMMPVINVEKQPGRDKLRHDRLSTGTSTPGTPVRNSHRAADVPGVLQTTAAGRRSDVTGLFSKTLQPLPRQQATMARTMSWHEDNPQSMHGNIGSAAHRKHPAERARASTMDRSMQRPQRTLMQSSPSTLAHQLRVRSLQCM